MSQGLFWVTDRGGTKLGLLSAPEPSYCVGSSARPYLESVESSRTFERGEYTWVKSRRQRT